MHLQYYIVFILKILHVFKWTGVQTGIFQVSTTLQILTPNLPKFSFSITNLNTLLRVSISLWVLISSSVAILTS